MTIFMLVATGFVVVAGVTFAVGALLLRLLPGLPAQRLAAPLSAAAEDVSILRWAEGEAGALYALVERLGRRLLPRDPMVFAQYRRRLILAGFHNPNAVALFLGAKITIAIALAVS